jgi:hypothetical protein
MNIPSIIIYVPPRTCSRFRNFGSVTERISAGDSTENGKAYLGGVGLLPGPPPLATVLHARYQNIIEHEIDVRQSALSR